MVKLIVFNKVNICHCAVWQRGHILVPREHDPSGRRPVGSWSLGTRMAWASQVLLGASGCIFTTFFASFRLRSITIWSVENYGVKQKQELILSLLLLWSQSRIRQRFHSDKALSNVVQLRIQVWGMINSLLLPSTNS